MGGVEGCGQYWSHQMPYSMAGEELPSKIRRVLEDEDSSGSNLGIEVLLANTSVDAANQDQHEIFGAGVYIYNNYNNYNHESIRVRRVRIAHALIKYKP